MSDVVFGMILQGGPLMGSRVRDVRLAGELVKRGYPVHVWWAAERARRDPLPASVRQRWLFHIARYLRLTPVGLPRPVPDAIGRLLSRITPGDFMIRYAQRRPRMIRTLMKGFLGRICAGVETDRFITPRFARELRAAGVTHLMPMVSPLAPWALAARARLERPPKVLVTFMGYEVAANYAREFGLEERFYEVLRTSARASDFPPVVLSRDYARRVSRELDIPLDDLRIIHPGIPEPMPLEPGRARDLLEQDFPGLRDDVPLVTFFGRQDAEKGIDLLLYAAAILGRRGTAVQLVVCGPTLHGESYADACRQIAQNLRLDAHFSGYVSDEVRAALFVRSDVVVCPSIFYEPFGMVPVEAMSYGTPAVVPDTGGIVEAIEAEGQSGGVTFRSWDSGDLADKIARVLTDDALRGRLSEAGPHVARYYSVERMTDRVLEHMGLPPRP